MCCLQKVKMLSRYFPSFSMVRNVKYNNLFSFEKDELAFQANRALTLH
jgi:hypothetical protein